jgi:hypothetical protein
MPGPKVVTAMAVYLARLLEELDSVFCTGR